jgi:hypothetical protein
VTHFIFSVFLLKNQMMCLKPKLFSVGEAENQLNVEELVVEWLGYYQKALVKEWVQG